jgi:hypothetical protein
MINIKLNFKRKGLFILLGGISIISFLYILIQTEKPKSGANNTTISAPQGSAAPTQQPSKPISPGEYFINKILSTEDPIMGFSWIGKKLIYSTGAGIYEVGNENYILKMPVENISWSKNGKAVFTSNSKRYFFNVDTKDLKEISEPAEKMIISPTGLKVAFTQGGALKIFNTASFSVDNQTSFEEPDFLTWPENEDYLLVSNKTSTKRVITILEASTLKEVRSFSYNPWVEPIGISPDGNTFVAQTSNNLAIHDIKNNTDNLVEFSKGSKLKGSFTSNNELFLTETYNDPLQRKITNFWVVNLQEGKILLANSMPILGGINPGIPYSSNFTKNIIPIAANKGGLWFLSLKPGVIPTYQNSDIYYYSAPQNSHKDKGF